MRIRLLALVVLLFGSGSAFAVDPPIVFQVHPVGRVLDELRTAADLLGGEKAVILLNQKIKKELGDKGFEGLDIGRPIVGYVVLAPKPEEITAVVAIPFTSEREFLDLCERANHQKPMLAGKEPGIYRLPPLDYRYQALMRFSEQYAYIAYGAKPAPALDSKALVSMPRLYEPNERGLVSGRIYFDRIPLTVKLALPTLLGEIKKTILKDLELDRDDTVTKAILPEVEKLVARYVKLAAGADELVGRVLLDPASGNLSYEATLKGKPQSELSSLIAARKPTGNKFGGLIETPDTVAGFKVRLPFFEEEIRSAVVAGLEASQKESGNNLPPNGKDFLNEIFKGFSRTVKTGQFDLAAGVRGPDKNGWFTALGAIAFEDTKALEAEFKNLVTKTAPPDIRDAINWDVAKAGTVNIHTWKPQAGGFLDVTKVFGGDDCLAAFAFEPHGIFVVMGPDAVETIKAALTLKPHDSLVLDVVMNTDRLVKLYEKISPNEPASAKLERALGKEDKLVSAMSMSVAGGQELTARFTINLRLLPRAGLLETLELVEPKELDGGGVTDVKLKPRKPLQR